MRVQTLADVGIEIPPGRTGEIDLTCPKCSPIRKKSRNKCLSVNTVNGTWCCHHCGWSGRIGGNVNSYGRRVLSRVAAPAPPRSFSIPKPPLASPLPKNILAYFAHRDIPESILAGAGITAGTEWCPQLEQWSLAIRFPYVRDGQLVNIKYRTLNKHFWMVKGAQRILYGLDDITKAEIICVVEGELDKLSIDTAGGPPTVSVPDGAPPPKAKHYASKFAFLDATAMARLWAARTVLIGTDMDAPGSGSLRSWHAASDSPSASVCPGIPARMPTRCSSSAARRPSWMPLLLRSHMPITRKLSLLHPHAHPRVVACSPALVASGCGE